VQFIVAITRPWSASVAARGVRSTVTGGRAVETRKPLAEASRSATTATGPTAAKSEIAIAAPDCTDTIASTVAPTPASVRVRDGAPAAPPTARTVAVAYAFSTRSNSSSIRIQWRSLAGSS
jgi:hypothetical protein